MEPDQIWCRNPFPLQLLLLLDATSSTGLCRHNEAYPAPALSCLHMEEVYRQMDAKHRPLQRGKHVATRNPKVSQNVHCSWQQNSSSCEKLSNFRGKKRDQKIRNTDPKIDPKTNPCRFLGYYKYKEGPFLGATFWTPKMCSKAWFSGPFSGDLDFTRNP